MTSRTVVTIQKRVSGNQIHASQNTFNIANLLLCTRVVNSHYWKHAMATVRVRRTDNYALIGLMNFAGKRYVTLRLQNGWGAICRKRDFQQSHLSALKFTCLNFTQTKTNIYLRFTQRWKMVLAALRVMTPCTWLLPIRRNLLLAFLRRAEAGFSETLLTTYWTTSTRCYRTPRLSFVFESRTGEVKSFLHISPSLRAGVGEVPRITP